MSDWTPTTAEVRVGYVVHTSQVQPLDEVPAIADSFDRWLAQHDAEVKAAALREAADEVHIEARWSTEQQMAGRAVRPVERMSVIEATLRDRADRIEKGSTDE